MRGDIRMLAVYDQPLVSNGYTLSNETLRLVYLVPTDPRLPMEELREQYREQGYLWLKGLLDRDSVLAFRRRFFESMRPTGMVAAGSDGAEGLFSGTPPDRSLHDKLVMEFVRTAAY